MKFEQVIQTLRRGGAIRRKGDSFLFSKGRARDLSIDAILANDWEPEIKELPVWEHGNCIVCANKIKGKLTNARLCSKECQAERIRIKKHTLRSNCVFNETGHEWVKLYRELCNYSLFTCECKFCGTRA